MEITSVTLGLLSSTQSLSWNEFEMKRTNSFLLYCHSICLAWYGLLSSLPSGGSIFLKKKKKIECLYSMILLIASIMEEDLNTGALSVWNNIQNVKEHEQNGCIHFSYTSFVIIFTHITLGENNMTKMSRLWQPKLQDSMTSAELCWLFLKCILSCSEYGI